MKMDYEKIGLKCGIEIHQQLDSGRKLFCSCSSSLIEEKPSIEIKRKMRPVTGEGSGIDIAAAEEKMRDREFHYMVYPSTSCLVETDEEPPHEIDKKALDTALEVATLLNCIFPDEIIIMRKLVIDGSDTSGFQRTALIGFDGKIKTSFGTVGITNINLEEDSSQIIKQEKGKVYYGLNRLGIPLIEIGTTPDAKTPNQVKELAEKIGMILRSTEKVKRGLGTIRQDLNISIKGGARIEIKGAQELNMLPKWVEYEAERQLRLIEIKKDLLDSGFAKVSCEIKDVTEIFHSAESRITKGKKTFAVRIPGFAGYLKRHLTPTRTLGREIADYVKVKGGIKGIIHTDEDVKKYKLSREFEMLFDFMEAEKGDTLIIAVAEKDDAHRALKATVDRINQLLEGVPEETRRALDDGNSEYMRPLPGAARMYPETDHMTIRLTKAYLENIRKNLPELWDEKIKRIARDYKISEEISRQIVRSGRSALFEEIVKKGADAKAAATTLTATLSELKRKEGLSADAINDDALKEIFCAFSENSITRAMLPHVIEQRMLHPKKPIEEIIEECKRNAVSHDEIRDIISKIVRENKELAKNPRAEKILMGMCMEKLRGKAEGRIVMEILRKELEEIRASL